MVTGNHSVSGIGHSPIQTETRYLFPPEEHTHECVNVLLDGFSILWSFHMENSSNGKHFRCQMEGSVFPLPATKYPALHQWSFLYYPIHSSIQCHFRAGDWLLAKQNEWTINKKVHAEAQRLISNENNTLSGKVKIFTLTLAPNPRSGCRGCR